MVHGELGISVRKMLDLLLLREDLLVKQINLLSGSGVVVALGLLAGSGSFAANIVEGILAVGTELGVFKFPRLAGTSVSRELGLGLDR
jgi:hypothetical protein